MRTTAEMKYVWNFRRCVDAGGALSVSRKGSPARSRPKGEQRAKGRKDEGGGRRVERSRAGERTEGQRESVRERERERGFRALRRGGCPRLRFVGNGRSITRRSSSSAPAHPASPRQGPMPQKTGVEPTLVLPVPPSPRKGQTLPFLLVSLSDCETLRVAGTKECRMTIGRGVQSKKRRG